MMFARLLGLCWPLFVGIRALSIHNSVLTRPFLQQSQSIWQLAVVLDDNGENSKIQNSAIIPSGEEALYSANMARNIRKYRQSRGLVKVDDRVLSGDNEDLTRIRESALKKSKIKGWKTVKKRSISDNQVSSTKQSKVKIKTYNNKSQKYRSNGMDLPYSSTIQALRQYYKLHGDLVMPRRYCVPENEAYPREWHGIDLASTVYDMKWWQKHVKQKPDRVAELGKMGFLWERLQPEWNLVLEALVTYKLLHGAVLVPGSFVVPTRENDWPIATWGLPLGNCVYRIRNRGDFLKGDNVASRRHQLDGLGFVWDVQEHRFQKVYAALKHFALIEGHDSSTADASHNTALRVPSSFIIPKTDAWPKELWGYSLGAKCNAIRQKQLYVKDNPRRQRLLESLRFQWRSGNASLGWLEVVHAAAIYSKLHNRILDVPFDFTVPAPPTDDPTLRIDIATAADGLNDGVWPWPGESFVYMRE